MVAMPRELIEVRTWSVNKGGFISRLIYDNILIANINKLANCKLETIAFFSSHTFLRIINNLQLFKRNATSFFILRESRLDRRGIQRRIIEHKTRNKRNGLDIALFTYLPVFYIENNNSRSI